MKMLYSYFPVDTLPAHAGILPRYFAEIFDVFIEVAAAIYSFAQRYWPLARAKHVILPPVVAVVI